MIMHTVILTLNRRLEHGIIDGLMLFTGTSNGASGGITLGSNTDAPTTGTQTASNIIDLGITSGVPTSRQRWWRPRSWYRRRSAAMKLSLQSARLLGSAAPAFSSSSLALPTTARWLTGSYTVMWTWSCNRRRQPRHRRAALQRRHPSCRSGNRSCRDSFGLRFITVRHLLDLFGRGLGRPGPCRSDRRHHWRSVRLSRRYQRRQLKELAP